MTRQSYKISRNICEITEHGPSRFFHFHFFEIGDTAAGHQFILMFHGEWFTGRAKQSCTDARFFLDVHLASP